MTRTERLLRLARLRGDRLAIATLETSQGVTRRGMAGAPSRDPLSVGALLPNWSEAELRAAWGDR